MHLFFHLGLMRMQQANWNRRDNGQRTAVQTLEITSKKNEMYYKASWVTKVVGER